MIKRSKLFYSIAFLSFIVIFSTETLLAAEDPAITRTRQQALMLDDLYKTVIVLVTEHYVKDPSILSAATAGKAIFAAMKEKGWHEVRLVGLTDIITNPENKPKDDFEKTAKEKLLDGDASYEKVVVLAWDLPFRWECPGRVPSPHTVAKPSLE